MRSNKVLKTQESNTYLSYRWAQTNTLRSDSVHAPYLAKDISPLTWEGQRGGSDIKEANHTGPVLLQMQRKIPAHVTGPS